MRRIRNELERRGHNPLLFFLKCLEADDAWLPELIGDEIKAREWFILCDSPHAKNSGWVQQEVELMKAMEGKVFENVGRLATGGLWVRISSLAPLIIHHLRR